MKIEYIYQLIILATGSYFIASRIIKYKRREVSQSLVKLMTVVFIWLTIILFTVTPRLASSLFEKLGFHENTQTLFFAGMIVIFFLLFRFLSIIEKLERDFTEMIRKDAIDAFMLRIKKKK